MISERPTIEVTFNNISIQIGVKPIEPIVVVFIEFYREKWTVHILWCRSCVDGIQASSVGLGSGFTGHWKTCLRFTASTSGKFRLHLLYTKCLI